MPYPAGWFADYSQLPLATSTSNLTISVATSIDNVWLDSLILPVYVAGVSALAFLVQFSSKLFRKKSTALPGNDSPEPEPGDNVPHPEVSYFRTVINDLGGGSIFTFRLLQLLNVLALLGVSCEQLRYADALTPASDADTSEIVRIVHVALYGYLSGLALLAVFGGNRFNDRAYAHLSWILALIWSTYLYRDVWSLAKLEDSPMDAAEGLILWAKLGMLTISGVLIPLFVPRKITPMDPNGVFEPNPEQTASLYSLLTYTFLGQIVWLAYRIPHLSVDLLPALPEYDYLKNLVGRSFHRLDPMQTKTRRHMALRLIRVFWVELCHLAAMSIAAVIAAFSAPISINQLLIHFESGGAGDTVQPWFWIVLLFLGSVFKSIADQWFVFKTTRISVRMQAIITELVFEHALRIRMKAETSEDSSRSGENTAVVTPDTASQADPDGGSSESGDTDTDSPAHSAHSSSSTAVGTGTNVSTNKGKGKAPTESVATGKKSTEPPKEEAAAKKGGNKNLVGRINNLVSSDLQSLQFQSMYLVFATIESPFQITLCMVFLYRILGWSAWAGFAAMLITLPIPGYITKLIQGTQREKMKRTDARVQLVSETMSLVRMIKLFGWESRIEQQLYEKREEELVSVRRNRMLGLSNNMCNFLIPVLIMLSTFFTYTVIMKETLTASKVFSAIAVFNMLRTDIAATFYMLPNLVQGKVALERIQDFLENTELIDSFTGEPEVNTASVLANFVSEEHQGIVGLRHMSFTWANDSIVSETPGGTRRRTFVLNVDDEVIFRRGKLNLVIGPTGAGKTSLLMALLGEMHCRPAGPDSFVSLPRAGGVAYVAQESWVQNDTIKNNIVFGAPFDEARYDKVIEQCALKRDLELFDAGDQTEVGEKGITLSGGQKARVTLARAVYSNAEIVLMDDILAALDVHTSRWIVDKCLKGDLLRGRTIILVTHNVAMVSPIADFVVDIGSDGRILSQGSLSSVLAHDEKLLKGVQEEQEELKKAEQEIDQAAPDEAATKLSAGKLVVAEEVEAGHVGWKAMVLYLGNMSRRPILFWSIYISGQIARQFIGNIQGWYLGYWASQYELHSPEEVDVGHYLTVYTLFVIGAMFAMAFCVFYYVFGSIRAGRIIHKKLVTSILGTTLRWLDKTPTARIIARCTEDIQTVDTRLARCTENLVEICIFMILKVFAVIFFTPVFIVPAIVVSVAGALCGNIYMKAQLCVKREMSNAKAPVLGHFGAAVSGITSIRAYGAQEAFIRESYKRIDKYSRILLTHENLNRWVTIRVDLIGTLFATSLAAYLTYIAPLSASNTGFSLTMATAFSGSILYCVRLFNEFEIAGNRYIEKYSLERIQQYLLIEHEPEPTPEGVPPAYWPASGKLEVHNLSARYSSDGAKVLNEVSFEVASGERVGIVGRTGSGKSSLTLALLRCILTEGAVRFDGLLTDKINLDALRSSVTIIPQIPELLSGTLRQNLDPFSEYDDAVLHDALRSAGLFNLQDESDQSRITLDTEIAGGGANLSIGQRQVLALARAIVRRSKLLILDEATSAIDYETDTIIQNSLRTELGKDVTLLTVAHRLQTIMDADKIMVLDAGHIVEFGRPGELLENENGILRALVDESGDREKLYQMARAASTPS